MQVCFELSFNRENSCFCTAEGKDTSLVWMTRETRAMMGTTMVMCHSCECLHLSLTVAIKLNERGRDENPWNRRHPRPVSKWLWLASAWLYLTECPQSQIQKGLKKIQTYMITRSKCIAAYFAVLGSLPLACSQPF